MRALSRVVLIVGLELGLRGERGAAALSVRAAVSVRVALSVRAAVPDVADAAGAVESAGARAPDEVLAVVDDGAGVDEPKVMR